jgi:hypothetical protein
MPPGGNEMKIKRTGMVMAVIAVLTALSASPLFAQSNGRGMSTADYSGGMETAIRDMEPGTLSVEETEGILLMREEEKLARDVYLTLYEKWNIPVFLNVAQSEETHMDAMELLIERYGLTDPVADESASKRGTYAREEFNKLYTELTEQGLASYQAALEVGALIEDLDIADLQKLLSESGSDDVKVVYQNLLKGSRNHLRSFVRQLERQGRDYSPVYISPDDYEGIISGRNEAGLISDPDFSFR